MHMQDRRMGDMVIQHAGGMSFLANYESATLPQVTSLQPLKIFKDS